MTPDTEVLIRELLQALIALVKKVTIKLTY